MVVMVMFMLVEHMQNVLFLGRQKMSHFMHDILRWSHVKIDEWLDNFVAVLVLGDLEGEQGINIDQAEVQPVGTN